MISCILRAVLAAMAAFGLAAFGWASFGPRYGGFVDAANSLFAGALAALAAGVITGLCCHYWPQTKQPLTWATILAWAITLLIVGLRLF